MWMAFYVKNIKGFLRGREDYVHIKIIGLILGIATITADKVAPG
jgi:hypothetical protein